MRRLGSFLLLLLTIILLVGFLFFAYLIYNDLMGGDTVQTVHTDNDIVAVDNGTEVVVKTEKKSIGETIADIFTTKNQDEVDYSEDKSSGKFFYEQLNSNQKIIYNGLQENKDKLMTGTHKIKFGNKFYDTLSKEKGGDVLGDDYQTAIEAFTHDNSDLFYLDISKMYLNMETSKRMFSTTYNVYIAPADGGTYYAKGFSSEAQIRQALDKIEKIKNAMKKSLSGNTYKDVKMIHDYLINNIEYDQTYSRQGRYTIYGALVEKCCVCEGYARAFSYLAEAAGINTVFMQGKAINTDGKTENHAWNAVKLNGSWYLIDTTWDDPIIVGSGFVLNSAHYKYFLKGSDEFYKDHTLERQFTDNGKVFNFPAISRSNY